MDENERIRRERDILLSWAIADKAKPMYSVIGYRRALDEAKYEIEQMLRRAVENQLEEEGGSDWEHKRKIRSAVRSFNGSLEEG